MSARPAPAGGESGLVVTVPQAEAAIAGRHAHDPDAALAVPAHVTVLYPFVLPTQLTEDHLLAVQEVVAEIDAFDFTLTSIDWFGEAVVWLAPEPAAPFVALTEALAARFPDYPLYGGAYDEITPHLTILADVDPAVMRALAAEIEPRLPIAARATEVTLMARTGVEPFTVRRRFPLRSR